MLDIVLFSALEKHAIGIEVLNEESGMASFMLRLYHDFKPTMVEVNLWGAFSAIGFTHDTSQDPYGLLFDKEKLRQSRGFVEPWSATCIWRACRRGVNEPNLDGLTNQNKLI
jgi:hypothetical protein